MTKKRHKRTCKYPGCTYYKKGAKSYCCNACSADAYDDHRLMVEKRTWTVHRTPACGALKKFMKFLAKQDKIVIASDLLPGMLYTHLCCTATYTRRCCLWTGLNAEQAALIGNKYDYDAQVNIEIENSEVEGIFSYIWKHKTGEKLTSLKSWEKEE